MKRTLAILLLLLFSSATLAEDNLSWASGSWFNPNRNYEGFIVQVLPGNTAVVTWFTYPPEGEDSDQAWIIGSGSIDGNRIVITGMQRPMGATFGPDFNPDDVECEPDAAPEPDRVIAGRSGLWYDPAHDGEGWMLETLPNGSARGGRLDPGAGTTNQGARGYRRRG